MSDFVADKMENTKHGIELVDDIGDKVRINKNGKISYIPNVKSVDGSIVYNTYEDYNISDQIISTKSPIKDLSGKQISRLNNVGGIELIDKTSFRVGNGEAIDENFSDKFNRNIEKVFNEKLEYIQGRKVAWSTKKENKNISIIINTGLLNIFERTIIGNTNKIISDIISDNSTLRNEAKSNDAVYTFVNKISNNIAKFDSSYGGILPSVDKGGSGIFSSFNKKNKYNYKKVNKMMEETMKKSDVIVVINE